MGLAPPPSKQRRAELSDFLRQRRAQLAPEDAALEPGDSRRRTPGLRREEVARLAGVGLSWYTWLEQGRDIKPSAQVLDALARVLGLNSGERAHLFHLARVELPLPSQGNQHVLCHPTSSRWSRSSRHIPRTCSGRAPMSSRGTEAPPP